MVFLNIKRFDGLFLVEGSADPFSEKVLRAAKDAVFKIPYQMGSKAALWSLIKTRGFHPYAGDLKGKDPSHSKGSRDYLIILFISNLTTIYF